MNLRRLAAVAVVCLISAHSFGAEALAITGGTVHTVSDGTLEGATLLVVGDQIAAVGIDISIPTGTDVVDATDLHVYPSLISANTALGLVEISSVRGTVDIREVGRINPNIRTEVAVNPELVPALFRVPHGKLR